MKNVLLTNLFIQKYTGSELHTIEIAEQFNNAGYDVYIATFSKADPLISEVDPNIHVFDVLKEDLDTYAFDIIFVQHYVVLDHLLAKHPLQYKHIIVSKLSSFNVLENLPSCYKEADIISCVSQECLDGIKEKISKGFVFPNSVPQKIFDQTYHSATDKGPKKIGVISNHIPDELFGLKDYFDVDYIGFGSQPQKVDSNLLKKYDLILTIGRTVQYCFALNIPVYVYDQFGGPGFLNKENFELAKYHNFSGRGFNKKTSEEIIMDVQSGYAKNSEHLEDLHRKAQQDFCLETNFYKLLDQLNDNDTLKTLEFSSNTIELEKDKNGLFTHFVYAHSVSNLLNQSQIYIDNGLGFHEEESIKWDLIETYTIQKKILLDPTCKQIRFDPSPFPCICKILSVFLNQMDVTNRVVPVNAYKTCDSQQFFIDDDPQYLLEDLNLKNETELTITYICKQIDHKKIIHELIDENNKIKTEIEEHKFKNKLKKMLRG